MLVNLSVNVGIMLAVIYIYFSSNYSSTRDHVAGWQRYLTETVATTAVGLLQLMFSIEVSGIRLDFRGLLLALAFKYLKLEATISSLLLLTMARFFWGSGNVAMANVVNAIYLLLSMPLLLHFMKGRLSDTKQLVVLVANTTLTTHLSTFLISQDFASFLYAMPLFWLASFSLLYFSAHIIRDMSQIVDYINYDSLTDLYNQRRFRHDLAIIEKLDQAVTIVLLDIDHFKSYNDSYGHEVGDKVLKQFGEFLKKHINSHTTVYRVGGEEFALIITGQTTDQAEAIVQRLHENTAAHPYTTLENKQIIQPSFSMGVAHRAFKEPLMATYRRADQATYYCKENGRNQVKVADFSLDSLTDLISTLPKI